MIDVSNIFYKFLFYYKKNGLLRTFKKSFKYIAGCLGLNLYMQPYEYVQIDIQKKLNLYCGVDRKDINTIIIVGAHLGYEVNYMLRNFPNSAFKLFEASPRYFSKLEKRFDRSKHRVEIFQNAVSSSNGKLTFYETNVAGSGSLLKVGDLASASYGMTQQESYEVESITLDFHSKLHGYDHQKIDCLWIDTQGAELFVLKGAEILLAKCMSVFVEVSIFKPLYEGASIFSEIQTFLNERDFILVSLGVDSENGTGNAFFIKDSK